jgi:hypothetical protein
MHSMEDLQKEFVPYELALRMKALGFDEPCFGYHTNDKDYPFILDVRNLKDKYKEETKAPTFSQAFRWFRENHYLCKQDYIFDMGVQNYAFIIYSKNDGNLYDCCYSENDEMIGSGFNTYEEAELACLDKLIEIVESN